MCVTRVYVQDTTEHRENSTFTECGMEFRMRYSTYSDMMILLDLQESEELGDSAVSLLFYAA